MNTMVNSENGSSNMRQPSVFGVSHLPVLPENSKTTSRLPNIQHTPLITTTVNPNLQIIRRQSHNTMTHAPFAVNDELMRRNSHFGDNHSKFVAKDHLLTEELKGNPQVKRKNLVALDELMKLGQTPEMILAVLHSKQSERATTYANQVLRAKRIFESNDAGHTGHIEYQGFHNSIDAIFGHLSEEQTKGLFAYFDKDNVGKVSWDDMQERGLMVSNPKSGSMHPKQISTQASFKGNFLF